MILGKYNTIKYNDVANSPGIAVSVYLQGCPHRCKNCHNPETWDFNGGKELTDKIVEDIFKNKINENGIKRSLCILGGEPLCEENLTSVAYLISMCKQYSKDTPIYIWSGYTIEQLNKMKDKDTILDYILKNIDYLIDGPFIDKERDLTLKMRGSRNQRIINMRENYIVE